MLWSTRPSCSTARHSDSSPCPGRRYSFGNGRPNSPISPIWAMISIGKRRWVSYSYAAGAMTVSAKSRTFVLQLLLVGGQVEVHGGVTTCGPGCFVGDDRGDDLVELDHVARP